MGAQLTGVRAMGQGFWLLLGTLIGAGALAGVREDPVIPVQAMISVGGQVRILPGQPPVALGTEIVLIIIEDRRR